MKKTIFAFLVGVVLWGQIPENTVNQPVTGVLGVGTLTCNIYGCTVYNAVGPNTLIVQAGSAQGTTDLVQVKNAAGGLLAYVGYAGGILSTSSVTASSFGLSGSIFAVDTSGVALRNSGTIRWSFDGFYYSNPDLSLLRKSAAPGVLRVGDGSTGYGSVEANNLTAVALASPSAPTVTQTCPDGTCDQTWSYTVEAKAGDGTTTVASSAGTTTTDQAATLDATHYNTITWTAVTGATKYTVRRTVSGGTPATTGALTTCTAITGLSCVDNGLVGDGVAAPNANTTGQLIGKVQTSAATDICTAGGIWSDASNIYVCTASGSVKKVAIAP